MSCIVLDLPTGRLATVDEADAVGAHPDLLADTLFAVVGTDIVPLYSGDPVDGLWRSKFVILREQPGFAWLRVNGPMAGDATVRLYADGALFDTQVISTRDPVRLPAGQFTRWEVEVEAAVLVTSIRVASTSEELR